MVASFWLATSSSHNPSTVFGKEEDPEIRRMIKSVKLLQLLRGFILPERSEAIARSSSRTDTPVVAVPVVRWRKSEAAAGYYGECHVAGNHILCPCKPGNI
jgi:hypothetical protein